MAISGKRKGKGKVEDLDEGKEVVRDEGKKAVRDKGKNVVRDDDEEGNVKFLPWSSLILGVTASLRSQALMGARVSYFGVSGTEELENEEYVVDEAEDDGSRDSSGEDVKVTRKKRPKR